MKYRTVLAKSQLKPEQIFFTNQPPKNVVFIYFLFQTQFGVPQKGLDDGLRHTLRLIQSGRMIP